MSHSIAAGNSAAPRSEPPQAEDARVPHAFAALDSITPGAAVQCGTGFFPSPRVAPPFRYRQGFPEVQLGFPYPPTNIRRRQRVSQFSSAVEQRFCKPWVVGSIPTTGSTLHQGLTWILEMRLEKCATVAQHSAHGFHDPHRPARPHQADRGHAGPHYRNDLSQGR